MTVALAIRRAGPGVTIQDGGRFGWLRYGVTPAGPMDPIAFAVANCAIGNLRDAAAIEISVGGLDVVAEGGPVDVAVIASDFDVRLSGRRCPSHAVLRLQMGESLSVRAGARGAWGYLAIGGQIDVPLVLGSRATHTRSALGGYHGRELRGGDVLPLSQLTPRISRDARLRSACLEIDARPIRVMLGPQDDCFAPAQVEAFLTQAWTLGPRSDRMAYALEGRPLVPARGHDIVSDGVARGAIQIPGSGLPFVLMADRQPTGGYPKIATVIGADLGRMAQFRPGDVVRFCQVSLAEAVAARRAIEAVLASAPETHPLSDGMPPDQALLNENLVSGVVDAFRSDD